jgi:cold shock CspA family protein
LALAAITLPERRAGEHHPARFFFQGQFQVNSQEFQGVVEHWHLDRGYGWIRADDGSRVFAHVRQLRNLPISAFGPNVGQGARFRIGPSPRDRRPMALDITLLEE